MAGKMLSRSVADDLDRDIRSSSGEREAVLAPFTGEVLHELPLSTPEDVVAAAAHARLAQLAWWGAGFAHRRRVLLRAHDLLLERRELLLDAVQSETGKTRGQAFEEVFQAATVTRYHAVAAESILRPQRRRSGIPLVLRTTVDARPKGVIGVITPWNFPLSLAAMDVIPALAAGNGVVQKADNQGALSILALRRAFIDAGVPAELWQVVTGAGAVVGTAVTDNCDHVCFTGSTATGRTVAVRAAERLIGASLELGGKNPLVVLDDVDPKKAAADAAYACFSSMGQLCVSIERVIVQRGVADEFIEEFASRVRSLTLGAAFDYTSDAGSLTLPSQLENTRRHVADAVAKGATLLTGGRPRPELGPLFYEPTVLTDVTPDMACHSQETFGPVVSVSIVEDDEEAIVAANSSEYGLNASVFGRSLRRARRIADGIDAGSVNINEGYRATFSAVDAPMGGVKNSGLGRRNGPEGLMRFVQQRTTAHATGLLQLPRTGGEFAPMAGLMVTLLVALRTLRIR
ncbi:succinate-semialdehyde dehydrogenase/glutarate-semialdehyde dehydrogenase [Homoserinimonas aerilata]|uniref:Succinate-semialdehyde dehydrogenase/glutarate-semialdehyde dehydrogenase n=1 Tax=Homoserinimonas aerilata TaxID=1162970 RepID=A0A542YGZ2_9MICO|nr:succinic semialdehyde dehydrogenase [Homoserinimonas aerilata]TQL47359.1 succinate-semialdehyde dehydrogenase/glutarate-semialdehyde dehydrogenase [Homoserinimonas aerilata]